MRQIIAPGDITVDLNKTVRSVREDPNIIDAWDEKAVTSAFWAASKSLLSDPRFDDPKAINPNFADDFFLASVLSTKLDKEKRTEILNELSKDQGLVKEDAVSRMEGFFSNIPDREQVLGMDLSKASEQIAEKYFASISQSKESEPELGAASLDNDGAKAASAASSGSGVGKKDTEAQSKGTETDDKLEALKNEIKKNNEAIEQLRNENKELANKGGNSSWKRFKTGMTANGIGCAALLLLTGQFAPVFILFAIFTLATGILAATPAFTSNKYYYDQRQNITNEVAKLEEKNRALEKELKKEGVPSNKKTAEGPEAGKKQAEAAKGPKPLDPVLEELMQKGKSVLKQVSPKAAEPGKVNGPSKFELELQEAKKNLKPIPDKAVEPGKADGLSKFERELQEAKAKLKPLEPKAAEPGKADGLSKFERELQEAKAKLKPLEPKAAEPGKADGLSKFERELQEAKAKLKPLEPKAVEPGKADGLSKFERELQETKKNLKATVLKLDEKGNFVDPKAGVVNVDSKQAVASKVNLSESEKAVSVDGPEVKYGVLVDDSKKGHDKKARVEDVNGIEDQRKPLRHVELGDIGPKAAEESELDKFLKKGLKPTGRINERGDFVKPEVEPVNIEPKIEAKLGEVHGRSEDIERLSQAAKEVADSLQRIPGILESKPEREVGDDKGRLEAALRRVQNVGDHLSPKESMDPDKMTFAEKRKLHDEFSRGGDIQAPIGGDRGGRGGGGKGR